MLPRLLIVQPTPFCNIDCQYCYLQSRSRRDRMDHSILEAFAARFLPEAGDLGECVLVWHGGEPLTAGIAWYEAAYRVLSPLIARGLRTAVQTNGIGLDQKWAELFLNNGTSIGFSIDGPQRFHDARRITKSGAGTWRMAIDALALARRNGFNPSVITVLHPDTFDHAREFFDFYRRFGITNVSFSIDEVEGANAASSMGLGSRQAMISFLLDILLFAHHDRYPLQIKEIERISWILLGQQPLWNEQVEPWSTVTVDVDGNIGTFSPELLEMRSARYRNYCAGSITDQNLDRELSGVFGVLAGEVEAGRDTCRRHCKYYSVCGGGAPVNKIAEHGTANAAETVYCALTTQAAADALALYVARTQIAGP